MSRVRVFQAVIAVVLAVAASACGSSSSSGSSAPSTPSISLPTISTPSASSGGNGGGGSGFCGTGKADIEKLQTDLAAIQNVGGTQPQQLQKMFQTILAAYSHAQSQAPSEIKGDIGVAYDFMKKLEGVFKAHNYNIEATAIAAQGMFTGPEHAKLLKASNHLKAWAAANCGA